MRPAPLWVAASLLVTAAFGLYAARVDPRGEAALSYSQPVPPQCRPPRSHCDRGEFVLGRCFPESHGGRVEVVARFPSGLDLASLPGSPARETLFELRARLVGPDVIAVPLERRGTAAAACGAQQEGIDCIAWGAAFTAVTAGCYRVQVFLSWLDATEDGGLDPAYIGRMVHDRGPLCVEGRSLNRDALPFCGPAHFEGAASSGPGGIFAKGAWSANASLARLHHPLLVDECGYSALLWSPHACQWRPIPPREAGACLARLGVRQAEFDVASSLGREQISHFVQYFMHPACATMDGRLFKDPATVNVVDLTAEAASGAPFAVVRSTSTRAACAVSPASNVVVVQPDAIALGMHGGGADERGVLETALASVAACHRNGAVACYLFLEGAIHRQVRGA